MALAFGRMRIINRACNIVNCQGMRDCMNFCFVYLLSNLSASWELIILQAHEPWQVTSSMHELSQRCKKLIRPCGINLQGLFWFSHFDSNLGHMCANAQGQATDTENVGLLILVIKYTQTWAFHRLILAIMLEHAIPTEHKK